MKAKDLDTLKEGVEKPAEALKAASEKLKTAKEELAAKPEENPAESSKGDGGSKVRLRCKNKTGKPSYYRAGLLFRPNEQEYEVSQEVAEILAADQWLEVTEIK